VLEDFRQHLRRDRDRDVRHLLLQDLFHSPLVGAIHVGIHEANGDRRDVAAFEDVGDLARASFIERSDDGALGIHALGDDETIPSRDIRLHHVLVGIPELFLVGAPDFDDVTKALGADHGGPRQSPSDKSIGGHSRPMREQRHLAEIDSGLVEAGHDGVDRVLGRRCLLDADEAGRIIHDADVGKGAADIHGHAQVLQGILSCSRPVLRATLGSARKTGPILPLS
jgi:hypothetical protein